MVDVVTPIVTPIEDSSNFIKASDVIAEGDTIIIYLNHLVQYVVVVKMGRTLNMKYGALRHEFLIGKRYGTQISASKGYVYPLRINSQLWTRTLSRQTQILYTPDIGTILMLLDARPSSVICESGTGSGSLSHAIATTIAPNGWLYSHDINESRVKNVQQDLKLHGLEFCTVALRDVCREGFAVEDASDGVFLDLPEPWLAVPFARQAISRARGGRLVNFSPCIEQVQRTCAALEANGFIQIEVLEVVPRKLKVTGVQKESLENLAARCVPVQNRRHPPHGDGGKAERPRKRQRFLPPAHFFNDPSAADVHAGERTTREPWLVDLMPFPFNQPTHTGYLVAATLLPASN